MESKEAKLIRSLAEIGITVQPVDLPADVDEVLKRFNNYEKEMGSKLDPKALEKYLSR